VRLLVITAMFITMATILHIIEGLLPPIPVTGAKLGLANIITVAAIFLLGPRMALAVAVGRTLLGFLFSASAVGFAMSFSGAVLSWAVMSLLFQLARHSFSLIGISLAGAVAHNIAQLTVASFVLENISTFTLLPLLMFFAVPTGIMVGAASGFLIRVLERISKGEKR